MGPRNRPFLSSSVLLLPNAKESAPQELECPGMRWTRLLARAGGVGARAEHGEFLDEGEVVAARLVPRSGGGCRIRRAGDLPGPPGLGEGVEVVVAGAAASVDGALPQLL
ncbi:hypothetical protein SORBI_3002G205201 [Sorghum bicolor]|uniref:Uncharacterized protein n=1 Tax=Sorghum bicolor TaxID=4558 RepID=A0A1W0W5A9_SORBI|nr:hypothetical protein SORBI_3002G205201 [Sorghum bicolor]